jgi:hypothetical protein
MCLAISGWINIDTYEISIYDAISHSLAQEKLGLAIERLREFEWPNDGELDVRVHDDGATALERLRNHLLTRFPKRELLAGFAKAAAAKHGISLVFAQSDADELVTAKTIILADGLREVSFPKLTKAGYINAGSATTLNLPKLTKAGDINADSATTLNLPKLTKAGNIYANSATTLNMSKKLASFVCK